MPTKTIPNKEVTRRCLRRVQRWNRVMPLAQAEHDWSWFASDFPEAEITCVEVMKALEVLELSGYIKVSYRNDRFNPESFVVTSVTEPVIRNTSQEKHA